MLTLKLNLEEQQFIKSISGIMECWASSAVVLGVCQNAALKTLQTQRAQLKRLYACEPLYLTRYMTLKQLNTLLSMVPTCEQVVRQLYQKQFITFDAYVNFNQQTDEIASRFPSARFTLRTPS